MSVACGGWRWLHSGKEAKSLGACPPRKLHQIAHMNVGIPLIEFSFPAGDRVGEYQIHIPVLPGRCHPCTRRSNRPLGLCCSEGRSCQGGAHRNALPVKSHLLFLSRFFLMTEQDRLVPRLPRARLLPALGPDHPPAFREPSLHFIPGKRGDAAWNVLRLAGCQNRLAGLFHYGRCLRHAKILA